MKQRWVILLCALSFLAGMGASWFYVRSHRVRLPLLDRSMYNMACIDFAGALMLAIRDDGTNRHYWITSCRPEREITVARYHDVLRKLSGADKDQCIGITIGPGTTVADARRILRGARMTGCAGARLLVASDPPWVDKEGGPLFTEVRIGPEQDLSSCGYAWYFDDALNRLVDQASKGTRYEAIRKAQASMP